MTRPLRWDNKESTPFSRWLRTQPEIDSGKGFITTDLDFLWESYKTKEYMILEEKRKMKVMPYSQYQQFESLDAKLLNDKLYRGFHLIQFENFSPEDGKIFIDYKEVSKSFLLTFLRFESSIDWYISFFFHKNKEKIIKIEHKNLFIKRMDFIYSELIEIKDIICQNKTKKKAKKKEIKDEFLLF